MRDLSQFLVNPLDIRDLGVKEEMAFATDNLTRMTANNPGGIFNTEIAATAAALEELSRTFTNDFVALGRRKSWVKVKYNFRQSMKLEIQTIAAKVMGEFGAGAREVREIFPKGRTVFGRARNDLLESHLEGLAAAIALHEDRLGSELVAQVNELRDSWLAIHQAGEISAGDKAVTEAERRAARAHLRAVLFSNLQKLMALYPNQPEMLGQYMQQHLLGYSKRSRRSADDEESEETNEVELDRGGSYSATSTSQSQASSFSSSQTSTKAP